MKQLFKYSLALVSVLFVSLSNAGADFLALNFSADVSKQLKTTQHKIARSLKAPYVFSPAPQHTLHITLKEVGDITSRERAVIQKHFKQCSKKSSHFTVYNPFKNSKLSVNKDGLVLLKLYPSKDLTQLAYFIDKNLAYLHKHKKLARYSKRMDFPYNGHVTLGTIVSKNKKINTKALADQLKAIGTHIKNISVQRYVLLQSNRPQEPRVYTNKGTFYLK